MAEQDKLWEVGVSLYYETWAMAATREEAEALARDAFREDSDPAHAECHASELTTPLRDAEAGRCVPWGRPVFGQDGSELTVNEIVERLGPAAPGAGTEAAPDA